MEINNSCVDGTCVTNLRETGYETYKYIAVELALLPPITYT